MTKLNSSLCDLIDKLIALPTVDRDAIKRATGVEPILESSAGPTRFYSANNLQLEDAAVSNIDYREGSGAGALIVFTLGGGCKSRDEILKHYKRLEITEIPRGHSLDEETTYSRTESWGKLSFGFPERSPNCLKSIVLNVSK